MSCRSNLSAGSDQMCRKKTSGPTTEVQLESMLPPCTKIMKRVSWMMSNSIVGHSEYPPAVPASVILLYMYWSHPDSLMAACNSSNESSMISNLMIRTCVMHKKGGIINSECVSSSFWTDRGQWPLNHVGWTRTSVPHSYSHPRTFLCSPKPDGRMTIGRWWGNTVHIGGTITMECNNALQNKQTNKEWMVTFAGSLTPASKEAWQNPRLFSTRESMQ